MARCSRFIWGCWNYQLHPRTAYPAVSNVDCSIDITMPGVATNQTLKLALGERQSHSLSALAAILRTVMRRHSLNPPTSVFSFEGQNVEKVSPARITNAFGQERIPDHIFDLQVFDGDEIKLCHDGLRPLEMKVLALPRDVQMLLRQKCTRLLSAVAAFLSACHFALGSLQSLFAFAQESRVVNLRARRERGEVFQAHINPHCLTGRRHWFGLGQIAHQQRIPAVTPSCNAKLLDRAFNRATQSDADGAYAGDGQFIAFQRTTSHLLDFLAEGMVSLS